jgi:hypothetical protein
MKNTKKLLMMFAALSAFVFCLTLDAQAQKRRTTRKRATATTKAANTAALAAANAAEIRSNAEKVSIQIKNVTKFVYLLGGIAKNIEDIDRDAKTKRLSQAALNINDTNKKAVLQSLRNLTAGLGALESEFRAKPALRNYNFHIQGISDMSLQAESLADRGQFTDSGKMLLSIVEKLSDTLVALP